MYSPIKLSTKREEGLTKLSNNLMKGIHYSPIPIKKPSNSHHSSPSKRIVSYHQEHFALNSKMLLSRVQTIDDVFSFKLRRTYVRTIALTKRAGGFDEEQIMKTLSKDFFISELKKHAVRLMRTLKIDHIYRISNYSGRLFKMVNFCRGVQIFQYNQSYEDQSLTSCLLNVLKFLTTKRCRSIHLFGEIFKVPKMTPLFSKLMNAIKRFKIDTLGLSINQCEGLKNSTLNEKDELLRVIRYLDKAKSVKSLCIHPMMDFLFHKLEHKILPKLQDISVNGLQFNPKKLDFQHCPLTFKGLKSFGIKITFSEFLELWNRVTLESTQLEKLSIEVLNPTVVLSKRSERQVLPKGFSALWEQINAFTYLKELKIVHKDLMPPDSPTEAALIPIKHISILQHIEHLIIESNFSSRRMLVNFGELGQAISHMSRLSYLKIHSYVTTKALADLFKSDSVSLTEIKKLDFHFEAFTELRVGPEWIEWIGMKQKINQIKFILGTKQDQQSITTLSADSVRNISTGISKIKGLKYLKLCLGILSYVSSHSKAISKSKESFVEFKNLNDFRILSHMLEPLKNLRKLILVAGVSYFTDDELMSILSVLKLNTLLTSFALGGNFKQVSKNFQYYFLRFLADEAHRFKNIVFYPTEYKISYQERITQKILSLFGKEAFTNNIQLLEL